MKKKTMTLITIFSFMLFFTSLAMAGDLVLWGELNGTYNSNESILTQNTCTVESAISVTLTAYDTISLKPGFWAKSGSSFTALIPGDDYIPSSWEMQYFGHTNYGLYDDPDGDQLNNLEEYQLGTNPNSYNTDNDNDDLLDRWEIDYFGNLSRTQNSDYDNDGYTNIQEYNAGTDPNDPDSYPEPATYSFEYDASGNLTDMLEVE